MNPKSLRVHLKEPAAAPKPPTTFEELVAVDLWSNLDLPLINKRLSNILRAGGLERERR